ncbi:MAG: prepilin peptidase [SAR324 cluster bacterium]|nr:prepilin peptidase [SAR324 cluster bacterium]
MYYWELTLSVLTGLAIGSFLNVCIDRLPLQCLSRTQKQQLLSDPTLSDILKQYLASNQLTLSNPARSICFACGYQIPWYENIPVLSYLRLKGQCRSCLTKYSQRSFWVESLNGIVYGLLYSIFGFSKISILLAFNFSFGIVVWEIVRGHLSTPKKITHFAFLIAFVDIGMILMQLS